MALLLFMERSNKVVYGELDVYLIIIRVYRAKRRDKGSARPCSSSKQVRQQDTIGGWMNGSAAIERQSAPDEGDSIARVTLSGKPIDRATGARRAEWRTEGYRERSVGPYICSYHR